MPAAPNAISSAAFEPGVRLLVCRLWRLEAWSHPDLCAPYWRLYHNAERGAEIVVGGETFPLSPDRILLVPPDTPFAARLYRPVRHLFVHFTLATAHETAWPSVYCIRCGRVEQGLLRSLRPALMREKSDLGPAPTWEAALDALALVHLCLRRVPAERFRLRFGESRVDRAIDWMSRHLGEPCGSAQWSAAAGLHPVAFARVFRAVTGTGPARYLRLLRLREACMLLHHSVLSVEEIAARTGFCDRFHLTKVFRKERGVGPAEFRRQFAGRAAQSPRQNNV